MKKKFIALWLAAALVFTAGAAPVMGADFIAVPEDTSGESEIQEASSDGGDLFSDSEAAFAEDALPEENTAAPEDVSVPEDVAIPEDASAPETAAPEEEDPFSALTTDEVFASGAEAKATASSARISCKGYKAGQLRITARIASPVKSKDNYYYLFQVNPATNKLTKQADRIEKPSGANKAVVFNLKTAGYPEYVMSKYAIAVKTKAGSKASSFTRISNVSYVQSPEKAAVHKAAYKLPKTKKGLQTTEISQLTSTKSKAVFFNLPVSAVLANNAERVPYTYNGKKYYFNKIGGYTTLVQQCNQKGIQVTMQLLLDWTPATKSLIAASAPGPRSAFYAWNSTGTASRQKMEALFSFLSELFGADNCYVSNWILGNEVNSCSRWNYAGNVSQGKYVQIYSEAFRCLYNAVRGNRASSKVFICLDHYWNNTWEDFAGKSILNSFHANLKNLQPGINWNLAYHAYPHPLTEADFWSGRHSGNMTNYSTSPVISLNNLSVLTNYIKRNFGSKTRIILSEQGFTSSQSQDIQAAALALGYYIAACNPMVDAFHIRSYQDEAHEVAQGLAMGIKGKKAFQVFVNMDSSNSLKYTSSYLKKQVGSAWSKRVPWYSSKRLYKMYRK